jgi:two-component sensor histidine kinase
VEGQLKLQGGPPDRWILLSVAFGAANPDGVSEFRVTLVDITERVRARQLTDYRRHLEQLVDSRTSALTKALGEKEVLLREVQHRVKNNLQFVSSMLSLEAGGQRSSRSRAAFKQCQLRVEAMALVHEMLQRSGTGGRVSSQGYVQELAVSVMEAYGISPGRIILDLQIEDIPMTVDTAVPVGLILNELITNAVTHGFPGHTTGCLRVSLTRAALDRYCLVVSDDGRGMPEEVDLASPATVGLTLVLRLTEQLGGSWECSRDGGTAFTIRFHEAAPRSEGA